MLMKERHVSALIPASIVDNFTTSIKVDTVKSVLRLERRLANLVRRIALSCDSWFVR